MGSQMRIYMEKIRNSPKGVSPLRISVEEVRGRNNSHWLGDILVDPKSFGILLFEGCPWLASEGAGEMERLGRLKRLLKGSGKRNLFLELSFAMLTTVRNNNVLLCGPEAMRTESRSSPKLQAVIVI